MQMNKATNKSVFGMQCKPMLRKLSENLFNSQH